MEEKTGTEMSGENLQETKETQDAQELNGTHEVPKKQHVEPAPGNKKQENVKAHKGSEKPAVITVTVYAVLVFLSCMYEVLRFVVSLKTSGISLGRGVVQNVLLQIGLMLGALVVVAMILIPVVLLRRKKLYHFRLSDLFLILGLTIAFYACNMSYNSFVQARMMNALGVQALVTVSVADRIFGMVLPSAVVGAAAIGAFILSRTKARLASIIYTAGFAFVFITLAVAARESVDGIMRFTGISEAFFADTASYVSGSAMAYGLTAAIMVASGMLLGLCTKRMAWGISGILLLAVTQLFVGIVAGVLLVETFRLGITGMAVTSYAKPFAYFMGALLPLIGMFVSRKKY